MGILNMFQQPPQQQQSQGQRGIDPQALQALQQSNPALYDVITQMMGGQQQPPEQPSYGGFTNGLDMLNGGGPGASGPEFSGGFRGFSGIGDMFDGGGMGKSGGAFEGGGNLSKIGNFFKGM
jgi:hypothetical protein